MHFTARRSLGLGAGVVKGYDSRRLLRRLHGRDGRVVDVRSHDVPFRRLGRRVHESHFMLMPCTTRSVLDSNVLVSSLSFKTGIVKPTMNSFESCTTRPLLGMCAFRAFSSVRRLINGTGRTASVTNCGQFLGTRD